MKAVILSALLGLGFSLNLRGAVEDTENVAGFVAKHQKVIEQIVNDGLKAANVLSEDGFVNIGDLINDGIKAYQDATGKDPSIGDLINDGIHIIGDISEDQLFHLGKDLKKAGHFISKNHKTIEEVAGIAAETGLFNLKKEAEKVGHFVSKNEGAIESGVEVVGDLANGNYEGAVDGTLDTITAATHQDELFHLGKALKKAGHFISKNHKTIEEVAGIAAETGLFNLKKEAKKIGHFVSKNKDAIESGVKVVGDLANGNYEAAVDGALNTISAATHQDELFHLGKDLKKAGHFISKNHKTIEEVAGIAAETGLFNLKKEAKKVGHFVSKNKNAIESGVKVVGDLANGNYEGAVDGTLDTISAATHQDELFHLGKDLKKAGHFISKHHKAIEEGIQIAGAAGIL